MKYRDEYLNELLCVEGRGSSADLETCPQCRQGGSIFRCIDCWNSTLLCASCMVTKHGDLPLHRVEVGFLC
jgi:hypothetical protein